MTEAQTIELQADDVVDGRYRICKRLGRGGMGTVYEAQQIKLDRSVALKVLRPEFANKELAVKRFEREAKSASSINHRNVVQILDFGHLASGELYYTMEFLKGRDLSQVLREQGALPWSRAGWILLQVVRAFAVIHDLGIVHRDIKPANCYLLDPKPGDDPDFVKILDFGIANLQDKNQATALTAASDIIGSVYYMAPEQAAADQVDARTDIYSLGIMMYELLTGQVPFRETNVFKVMMQHQQEEPRPPRELVPDLPPEVEAVILRAIAKRPEDRFQTMVEIEAALLPFVELPAASGMISRAGMSVERSAAASQAGRPLLDTQPGPTGTVVVGSSMAGTVPRVGAETTPRIGGSLAALETRPIAEPRPRGMLLPVLVALLVFGGAIALTMLLRRTGDGSETVATQEADATKATPEGADVQPTEEESRPISMGALPPPEDPYDPFADPFGAPPLRGRTLPTKPGVAGEGTEAPLEEVPLEEILADGSWLLAPGSIAGTILDEKRRPLAKARVCAWIVDPRAPSELRRKPRCTEADRRGRFELREVPPSFYDVTAFVPKLAPQSLLARDGFPLTVQPEQRSEGVELVLVPGGVEVRGTVKTKLNEALKGVSVSAVGSVRALTTTNDKGEFSLWMAQGEGEVGVVAWRDGYSDVVARGRATEPFALTMRRETVLIGVVIDAQTKKPLENARVRANPQQGGGLNPVVYTDEKGEFRISGLPDGSYRPTAHVGDDRFGQLAEPVKAVEAGVLSEITIKVPPPPPKPEPVPVPVVEPSEPAGASTGGDETSGDAESTGADTGGETEGAEATEPVAEPPVVARNDAASPTGSSPSGTGAGAPPTGTGKPAESGTPVEPAKPAAPAKPAETNQSIRKKAALKLKRCGTNGTIKITATYVLAEGRLFQWKVQVTGEAAKDPAVQACAETVAKGIKLLKLRANEVADFEPLVVKI